MFGWDSLIHQSFTFTCHSHSPVVGFIEGRERRDHIPRPCYLDERNSAIYQVGLYTDIQKVFLKNIKYINI